MAYRKPMEDEIACGLEEGWSKEACERGYDIFDYDGTGLLNISRIDDVFAWSDVTDIDCAIEAERSGFCKIIPVEELPEHFSYKCFGWIDTPENRKAIEDYTNK
jgi:hypothetical protein